MDIETFENKKIFETCEEMDRRENFYERDES
jgi:hypothetical protein